MNRDEYSALRHTYRTLRRNDRDWKPDPTWAYREVTLVNQVPRRPDTAHIFYCQFDPKIAATFLRRMGDEGRGNNRLPKGPEALKITGVRNQYGQFGGMDLSKRVALRSALRQIAALDAARAAA